MIWLIGAGAMAADYAKVLQAQKQGFVVIGRGESSANAFKEKTGLNVEVGGLAAFLLAAPEIAEFAVVSVGVDHLYETTKMLIETGVLHILVEKPGALTQQQILSLQALCEQTSAKVYVAYNRRFYSSVLKAEELIRLDGGVTSFQFEVTEWGHVIEKLDKPTDVLGRWFLANSTHVTDLAFFMGGAPEDISCFTSGTLTWHPSAAIFSGAGTSRQGALFSYQGNWGSAGRWSVEVLTSENRYIFRPMEKLLVQKRGTIQEVEVEVEDSLDVTFKPGLFLQVEAFLAGDDERLCSLDEQVSMFDCYQQMAGYQS